jgi:hypothetical protein
MWLHATIRCHGPRLGTEVELEDQATHFLFIRSRRLSCDLDELPFQNHTMLTLNG